MPVSGITGDNKNFYMQIKINMTYWNSTLGRAAGNLSIISILTL
jgi:hypothetical protein